MEKQTRVIVIGAGYAGLLAAVRLAMKTRRDNVSITLVNPSAMFVERPRLHQYAANQALTTRPIRDALQGSGVRFLQAEVQAIDTHRREVRARTSTDDLRLPYDYLLYTAGSTIGVDRVPGAREFAYTLTPSGPRSAESLKTILPKLNQDRGQLVVVGGGPTGIEAAAEFAESYPGLRVMLVTEGELAHKFGGRIQVHIRKALTRMGVMIRDQETVERVEGHRLMLKEGEAIGFDLCLWAGGFTASPLANEAGLLVNAHNQLLTDSSMRSISDPHIYGAGDAAQPQTSNGIPVRMAAYTAAITGAHAADCLADAIHGKQPRPLNFAYLGQGIALGRHDAAGFNNYPDDRPRNPLFTGILGVEGREFFVRLLADLPAVERRLPGIHFWPSAGRSKPGNMLQQERRAGD